MSGGIDVGSEGVKKGKGFLSSKAEHRLVLASIFALGAAAGYGYQVIAIGTDAEIGKGVREMAEKPTEKVEKTVLPEIAEHFSKKPEGIQLKVKGKIYVVGEEVRINSLESNKEKNAELDKIQQTGVAKATISRTYNFENSNLDQFKNKIFSFFKRGKTD